MFYPISYDSLVQASISSVKKINRTRISHLLFRITGTALTQTMLDKIRISWQLQGAENRILGNNIKLGNLCTYNNVVQGNGISTTEAVAVIQIGDLNLKDSDLLISVNPALGAGETVNLTLCGVMLQEGVPVQEYLERVIGIDAVSLENVLSIYDTTATVSRESRLTFENGSQLTINNLDARSLTQGVSQLEAFNNFALLFHDKKQATGSNFKIEFSADTTCLIVQFSKLNFKG